MGILWHIDNCGISNFLRHICICSSRNRCTGNCCTGVLCSSPYDHSSSSVLRSSHCHCCSSVLCSSSREQGSSCVLCHRSTRVIRGCSCVIRILWCPSVRRACNQHRALMMVQ